MKCVRMKDEQGVARVSNEVAAEAVAIGEVVYVNKQSYKRKMRLIAKHERKSESWKRGRPVSCSAYGVSFAKTSGKKGML